MKAIINGIKVEGTPSEIADFKKKIEKNSEKSERKGRPECCGYDVYDENGDWLGEI